MNDLNLNKKSPLDEKILNPLLASSGLTEEEQQAVKKELAGLMVKEMILKALQSLSKKEIEKVKQDLKGKSLTEQFKVIQEAIKNSPDGQKAVQKYLKKDLPAFVEKLLNAFLEKATFEQRRNFFRSSQ